MIVTTIMALLVEGSYDQFFNCALFRRMTHQQQRGAPGRGHGASEHPSGCCPRAASPHLLLGNSRLSPGLCGAAWRKGLLLTLLVVKHIVDSDCVFRKMSVPRI